MPDDAVWDLVQASRRQQRKVRRILTTKRILAWCCCSCAFCRSTSHPDEQARSTGSEDGDEVDDYVDVEHGLDQPHVPTPAPASHGPARNLEAAQEPMAPVPLLPSEPNDDNGRQIMTVDHAPSDAPQADLIAEKPGDGSSGLATVPDEISIEQATIYDTRDDPKS